MTTSRDGALRSLAFPLHEDLPPDLSDHELMLAVAGGDVRAYACLLDRHLRKMTALAGRITGNAGDADDVVQESFLRLWIHAPRWDPDGAGSVRTWLSRVVVNLCLDFRRRKPMLPLEKAGEIIDPAKGGAEGVRLSDMQRVVQALLQGLPERQRTAIVLCYFEEMSGQEIAQTMGLSAGAVESLLVRARRSLRKGLQQAGLVWGEDL